MTVLRFSALGLFPVNLPDTLISVLQRRYFVVRTVLDSNNHSVFALFYHLVLVVKYRRHVIDDAVSVRAREIFVRIAPDYNIELMEWGTGNDHAHIVFKAHPNSSLSKFINAYKSATSRLLKKEFPGIRNKLWKEMFWSRSFCLVSTGGAPLSVLKKYVASQGEKA